MLLATATWPDVAIALVTALPGLAAAYFAYKAAVHSHASREALRTPSGTTIGKQVEDTRHTSIANNYRLQSLGNGLEVPMPAAASNEEARVAELNTLPPPAGAEPGA